MVTRRQHNDGRRNRAIAAARVNASVTGEETNKDKAISKLGKEHPKLGHILVSYCITVTVTLVLDCHVGS